MKIGKLPVAYGMMVEGEWYIGVEIMIYHPSTCYDGFAFKPYFRFIFTKIINWGTPQMVVDGEKIQKIGGWWSFECPIGIFINIKII
ncbi:MAG: hypothetical protein WAV09_04080 [Minisyncoccia bacterium]